MIRAIEPTTGIAAMRRRRGVADERLLCQAPAGYARRSVSPGPDNGLALDRPPFKLFARQGEVEVVAGPRIGLTKAVELPWRYGRRARGF